MTSLVNGVIEGTSQSACAFCKEFKYNGLFSICLNPQSDHFGHVVTNHHPSCDEFTKIEEGEPKMGRMKRLFKSLTHKEQRMFLERITTSDIYNLKEEIKEK